MEAILNFLEAHPLFHGFSSDAIREIATLCQKKVFHIGEWILQEGDLDRELCLILSGKAEVLKTDHIIGILKAKDWSGSLILPEETRGHSVRSLAQTEVLLLPLTSLFARVKKIGLEPLFLTNAAKEVCFQLKRSDHALLESVKEQAKMIKTHEHVSKLIVYLFVALSLYFYMFKFVVFYKKDVAISRLIAPVVIVLIAFSGCVLIKSYGYKLSYYGVTFKNGWKVAKEATLFSLPILVLMVLAKWILVQKVEAFQGRPIFELIPIRSQGLGMNTSLILAGVYFLLIPIQEFLTRGFLQTIFREFFRGPSRVMLSILTSNLLFEIFHSIKSFSFALSAFCLGLLWGCLYEQQRSVLGVTISHALIAAWAFLFLGYQYILIR